MCIIHLVHYLQCGHYIPDVKANINDRCDAVSAALMFYHDQPSYEPLNEPLILPRTCQAVKIRGGQVPKFVLQNQAAWDEWMITQFVSNGFGFPQRRDFMSRALGAIAIPPINIHAPYPENQVRQYNALTAYQNRQIKAPNVVFTTMNGGCGRGSRTACHGHSEPPSPPPSPPTGPAPNGDGRYSKGPKSSSSLPGSDISARAEDGVRRTRSAMGLEQMPARTAAGSFELLKRAQVEADGLDKSGEAKVLGKSEEVEVPDVFEKADELKG